MFLTQITRSPAVRKGARPGVYALDRGARATLQRRLRRPPPASSPTLPQRPADLTEIRARRAQLTAEITKAREGARGGRRRRMTIRPARAADAEPVAAIYNHGIEERQATFETRPRTAQRDRRAGSRRAGPFLVATDDDGTILGFARVSAYSTREAYAGVGEHAVYVAPDARGRKRRRSRCSTRSPKPPSRRATTSSRAASSPPTGEPRALHRKAGFTEVGIQRRHGAARRRVEGHGPGRAAARRRAATTIRSRQCLPLHRRPAATAPAGRSRSVRVGPPHGARTPCASTRRARRSRSTGSCARRCKLTLGQLHIGMVDRGPAKVKGQAGRFPVLKRLSRHRGRAARAGDRGLAVDEHRRLGADRRSATRTPRPPARCCSPSRSRPEQLKEAMDAEGARGARRPLAARRARGPGRAVPRRRARQRRDRVPRLRPAAPADRPRGAADDAPLAADGPAGRPDDRRQPAGAPSSSVAPPGLLVPCHARWSTIPAPAPPAAAAAS